MAKEEILRDNLIIPIPYSDGVKVITKEVLVAINRNMKDPVKIIIMDAAGRDFHNFNVYFRDNPAYSVIAFTATQIPDIGPLLPAMGYSDEQTINSSDCNAVVIGTPIDLTQVINVNKPATRVRYGIKEIGDANLEEVVDAFLEQENV